MTCFRNIPAIFLEWHANITQLYRKVHITLFQYLFPVSPASIWAVVSMWEQLHVAVALVHTHSPELCSLRLSTLHRWLLMELSVSHSPQSSKTRAGWVGVESPNARNPQSNSLLDESRLPTLVWTHDPPLTDADTRGSSASAAQHLLCPWVLNLLCYQDQL